MAVVNTVAKASSAPGQASQRGRSRLSQSDSAIGVSRIRVAQDAQASRLSQLVCHWLKAFNAFLGLPRWKADAARPVIASA